MKSAPQINLGRSEGDSCSQCYAENSENNEPLVIRKVHAVQKHICKQWDPSWSESDLIKHKQEDSDMDLHSEISQLWY